MPQERKISRTNGVVSVGHGSKHKGFPLIKDEKKIKINGSN